MCVCVWKWGGPYHSHFDCYRLAVPAVSSVLVFWDKEKALGELPSVGDIPRKAVTSSIMSLIEEVSLVIDILHTCYIMWDKFVQSACVV